MNLLVIKRVLFILPALLLGVQAHAAPMHLLCEETSGENRFSPNKKFDEHHISSPIKEFLVHHVLIDTDTNTASYMGKEYPLWDESFGNRQLRKTRGYISLVGSFNTQSIPIYSDPKEKLLFLIDRSTLAFAWYFMNQGDWGEWWYERYGQCKIKFAPSSGGRRIQQHEPIDRRTLVLL